MTPKSPHKGVKSGMVAIYILCKFIFWIYHLKYAHKISQYDFFRTVLSYKVDSQRPL